MSVNPVSTTSSAAVPTGSEGARDNASSLVRRALPRPDSGTKPREEIRSSQPPSEPRETPQDEVQVQRTNGASGDIVIKYLDASGNLILQIPSAQVLGLARAVERALEEQAKRTTSTGGNALLREGGTSDEH